METGGVMGDVLGKRVEAHRYCEAPAEWLLSASPEIKRSFSSLPLYWQWLQKTKFPEYSREGTDGRRDPGGLGSGAKGCVAGRLIGAHPSLSFVSALCSPACCE